MKKSELKQIIKEELNNMLGGDIIIGILDRIEFKDSIVYYVNTNMGDLYVSNKLVDELGVRKG